MKSTADDMATWMVAEVVQRARCSYVIAAVSEWFPHGQGCHSVVTSCRQAANGLVSKAGQSGMI